MTLSQRWLAFSGVLSVGAGFLGGMMFARHRAQPSGEPYGRIYRIGDNIFIDQAALEYLKARAEKSIVDGAETCLALFGQMVCVRWFHDTALFPSQKGAVYVLRRMGGDSREAQADLEATHLLEHMQKFGLLEDGGRWRDWKHLESTQGAAEPRKALKGMRSPEKRKQ